MSEEKKQPLVYPLFSKARVVFEVSNQQTHKLFSVLGPRRWKELPADVRTTETLASVRKRFKTNLFRVHIDSA